jgi:putative ABC transport system permease protein
MFETFSHDLRFAFRTLARRPAFSVAAAMTLAVGIGATTAIFTIADAVLVTPLAYPGPERLLFVSSSFPGSSGGGDQLSYLDINEIAARTRTLEGIAAYNTGRTLQMRGGAGDPEPVRANIVSPEYLALLGATPERGRLFGPEDNQAPNGHPVVVVTHRFWQRRLAGDPSVVGRTIVLADVPLTVVGVLPASFRDVSAEEGYAFASDVFIPVMMSPTFGGATYLQDRNARNYWALARVKRGVTFEQARADVAAVGTQLEREHGATNRGFTFWAERLDTYLARDIRGPIILLLAGSAFVLLIGCANVANLLLARLSARVRELSVRRAVGARRAHIVSLVFAESLVVASIGGACGLVIAVGGSDAFRLLVPGELTPRLDAAGLNTTGLLFAAGLTIGVALLLGLASALRASKAEALNGMRDGARGTTDVSGNRLRRGLLVAEVAVAVVLVIASGLMLGSLRQLRKTDIGFRTDRLITLEMDLRSARYADTASVTQFDATLLRELRATAGVESALVWGPARPGRNTWVTFPGREDTPRGAERLMTWRHTVNAGALHDLGIPLVRGRDFTDHDTAAAPAVAIVSTTLANTLWPGEDAVGKRLKWRTDLADSPLLTVVGVAADAKHRGRLNDLLYPARDVYVPYTQRADRMVVAVVRTAQDPEAIVPAIRTAVRRIDPELPLFNITTMAQHLAEEEAETRFAAVLMTTYGTVALLLAAIGIYGVLSYHVTLRRREMAIRMALGSTRSEVRRLIVADGMRPALFGIGIGVTAAIAMSRYISSLLFGIQPRDPGTFAAVAGALATVALIATLLPARRATNVEPAEALRAE